jgi:hypothetical protein
MAGAVEKGGLERPSVVDKRTSPIDWNLGKAAARLL